MKNYLMSAAIGDIASRPYESRTCRIKFAFSLYGDGNTFTAFAEAVSSIPLGNVAVSTAIFCHLCMAMLLY